MKIFVRWSALTLLLLTALLGCTAQPDSPSASDAMLKDKSIETTAVALPVKVEAENYSAMSGIQTESCTEGTLNVGWIDTGDWMDYTVDVPETGLYKIEFRVASQFATGKFDLLAGGLLKLSLSIPNTGGWQNWTSITSNTALTAGRQTIRLKVTGPLFNINWFSLTALIASSCSTVSSALNSSSSSVQSEQTVGGLKLQMVNGTAGSIESTISPRYRLFNTGQTSLDLSKIVIRYFYTINGDKPQSFWCDWSQAGSANVKGTFDKWTPVALGTDTVLNVGFTAAAGTLSPGSILDIQCRVAKNDWSSYNQTDDYSFNASGSSFIDWTKAAVYYNGVRVWGEEPGRSTTSSSSLSISSSRSSAVSSLLATSSSIITLSSSSSSSSSSFLADFGPNVFIYEPTTPTAVIQSKIDSVYSSQRGSQFGPNRYAFLFKAGTYSVNFPVGFYTSIYGLGQSPNDVSLNGAVYSEAFLGNNNATCNFWRSIENFSVTPNTGTMKWAVSQACPFRRMHIKGSMVLHDNGGWSSGGFMADSLIDGQVESGSQQQWLSRNSQWNKWAGANWNMVFVGIVNPPSGNWPDPAYTSVPETPVVREKPYLYIDSSNQYKVFVPSLINNKKGASWTTGIQAGESIPIDKFYIAKAGTDNAATINNALSQGKNLILTPGIYHLSETIRVNKANTVILGIGYATLIPDNGVIAMTVADVDGVKIAGILFDAGVQNSTVLLEVGPAASSADHSANPTSLHDLFFRVGGAAVGKASTSIIINSGNVIGDHFWVWRADHGENNSVGWNINTAANGLIVNGNNVTIYGLFVEHYQQYQTLWNGNNGRTYFYQSELPYDVPNQSSWKAGTVNGFASYKVANTVTTHEAWGLGVYSVFTYSGISLESAIEVPVSPNVKFHHMVTVSLGQGANNINHVINSSGGAVGTGNFKSVLNEF